MIDKDRPDYTDFSGGWEIGRIYQTRGGPENLRWFWSLTLDPPMARSNRVASLEEAKEGTAPCRQGYPFSECCRPRRSLPGSSHVERDKSVDHRVDLLRHF
jgi:hypothetical protein